MQLFTGSVIQNRQTFLLIPSSPPLSEPYTRMQQALVSEALEALRLRIISNKFCIHSRSPDDLIESFGSPKYLFHTSNQLSLRISHYYSASNKFLYSCAHSRL